MACSCNGSLYYVRNTYLLHSHHRTLTFTTACHMGELRGGQGKSERVCSLPQPSYACTHTHTCSCTYSMQMMMMRHIQYILTLSSAQRHIFILSTYSFGIHTHTLKHPHTETSKSFTHSRKHAISPLSKGHICNAGDSSRRQQVIGQRDRER